MINNKSFTLIELLVVIVIIGILAGVVMISTSSSIDKANIAKLKVFEESVQNNLAANMVSRWSLDDGSGLTAKDIWGSNDGTLYNNPTWKNDNDCVSGGCLSFNGSNNYIDCGTFGVIGSSFTFSAWFKTSSNQTYNPILMVDGNTNGNPQLRTAGTGKVQFRYYNGNSLESFFSYNNNQWHHVIGGINNEGKYFLYVDGLSQETLMPNSILNWTGNIKIGLYSYSTLSYFSGLIDDVRIYNAALSSAQIKQNYIAGLNSMLSNGTISKEEYNQRINALAYEK
ncbi:MAG: LamG-like jellyroll fold domain-containing protein [Minisyncoccales bacterium]